MLKRMILMLAVVLTIVAGSRLREVPADSDGHRPGRLLSATARSRDDHRRAAGGVAGDVERDRHDGGGPGRHRERGPAGHRRSHHVRVRPIGSRGGGAGRARHPAGARAAGRDRGAARPGHAQLRPDEGSGERTRRSRKRSTTGRQPSRNRRTHRSARSTPPSQRKTIRAPFTGILGIRQVNLGQYLSAGDPLVPLQSLDPIYVNFGVPQQDVGQVRVGHRVRITTGDVAGVSSSPDASRPSTRSSTRRRGTFRCRRRSPIPTASCVPGCSCRPSCRWAPAARS